MLKTIAFSLFCLVPCLILGCSDKVPVREVIPVTGEVGYVQEAPSYNVVIPDSLKTGIMWNRSFPLLVHLVSQEEYMETGDTVLMGTDPFYSVEMERVTMALNIAEATGDTAAMDSLYTILTDSSSYFYVTSPATGVVETLSLPGSILQPGDSIASITGPPPDSVYILTPEYFHIRWPADLPGCTVTDSGLQCYGPLPGSETSIPGTWSLKPQFIYEEDLDSFLITAAGDSIPVTIIGSTDTSKIIYSTFPLDSIALTPW